MKKYHLVNVNTRMMMAVVAIICTMALPLSASAKSQFEKDWKRPIKEMPIYFQSEIEGSSKELPAGNASYCMATVEKGVPNRADFELTGKVTRAQKFDGNLYEVDFEDAKLSMTDTNGAKVSFDGSLELSYHYDKKTKEPYVKILLKKGEIAINDVPYYAFDTNTPETSRRLVIDITSDPKLKITPEYTIGLDNIFLTRDYTFGDCDQIEPNEFAIIDSKLKGQDTMFDDEKTTYGLLKSVISKAQDLKSVKGCTKTIIIRECPSKPFKGTDVSILKPNEIKDTIHEAQYITTKSIVIPQFTTDGYNVITDGDKVKIRDERWQVTFENGEFTEALNADGIGSYKNNVLTRADNSKLIGLKGLPSSKSPKYLTEAIALMDKIIDPTLYDLSKISGYNLTAGVYTDPDGLNEILDESIIIKSVKDAEYLKMYIQLAIQEEGRFWGPDRLLEGLRGHVKEVSTTIYDGEASPITVVVAFDEDGYYTKGSSYVTDSTPWSQLPREGEGSVTLKIDKMPFTCTIDRDSNGRLVKYAMVMDDTNMKNVDYDLLSVNYQELTFDWGDMLKSYTLNIFDDRFRTQYEYNQDMVETSSTVDSWSAGTHNVDQTKYEYVDFDQFGNWTKRTSKSLGKIYDENAESSKLVGTNQSTAIVTRNITYYDFDLGPAVDRMREKYPDLDDMISASK